MSSRTCHFSLKSVHPDEVLKIVKELKNSKSTGLDDIDTATLKLVIREILPALTHVINLSLINLEFPNKWKLAKVVPLLKKDDPSTLRTIDLLHCFLYSTRSWSVWCSSRWWSTWKAMVYYILATMVQDPSIVLALH